ncbi:hypothetical protein ABZ464_30665 [Streptomyces sp. NPDC005820]|uniref:hypothetical protein n=1 Tax=Streptomyces sp. NPDC005820 TaxID=3157069 RepID=UPI0033E176D8
MFKRTAVHVRGKTRSRKRKPVFAAFFAVAIAIALLQALLSITSAQAVSINDCPGGANSGEGSSSCPNLHNDDLNNQRAFPRQLYRGDTRLPYDIFTNGFTAVGSNVDIERHVHGGDNSNYISTTGTLGVAEGFARGQGLRNLESAARIPRCSTSRTWIYGLIPWRGLLESCDHGQVTARSFVYVIDPVWARNAVYIPDQIRGNVDLLTHYRSQDEWAYVHRIPREAILGVRIYRMTAHANGSLIQTRTITWAYDHFVTNPHHVEARIVYQPANDPNGHFAFDQDLNVPAIQANPYTRGCSTINRCAR